MTENKSYDYLYKHRIVFQEVKKTSKKAAVAKILLFMLLTLPIGLFVSFKFGDPAYWIYWGGIIVGQFTQQFIWNYV